jgi:CarboxypepD_reg-like domain/Outer membrane protein beta-barrel family
MQQPCFTLLLLLLLLGKTQAQTLKLSGKVTDSTGATLVFANVLATPDDKDAAIAFSATDEDGRYQLTLKKKLRYRLEVSYLGYERIVDSFVLTASVQRDFVLSPSSQLLQAVTIQEQAIPIVVDEDTTSFNVRSFTNGDERKLRDILEKLPGMEIDERGNVLFNGKRVSTLLVEGKPFFTGGTRLGVNNIPAIAVDKVEIIKNYSEIAYLRDFVDSENRAINIKLKKDKKKFVFGDIEVGAGASSAMSETEGRYLVHPTLFYYTPKQTWSYIGDFNNIGQKAFTFDDYMNFEGGINKLLSSANKFSNDFVASLLPQDVRSNRGLFNALNFNTRISRRWKLNAYHINSQDQSVSQSENRLTYLIDNQTVNKETRNTLDSATSLFTITKLDFTCSRKITEDMSTQTVFQTAEPRTVQALVSQSLLDSNRSLTMQIPKSWSLTQDFSYSNKFSSHRTSIINANFKYGSKQVSDSWSLTQPIFNQLIALESDTLYRLAQTTTAKTLDFSFAIKELWVLNSLNHFYPMAGYSLRVQTYQTESGQLYDNVLRNFNTENFGNDGSFRLHDPYIGLQYRFKIKDVTLKTTLAYHHYIWATQYLAADATTTQKPQWIPEFKLDWKIKGSENLDFKYLLNTRFNDAVDYSDRLTLRAFNSLYRGNPMLENELSHQLSLGYSKFKYPTGLSYNLNVSYEQKVAGKQSISELVGISQIYTSIYANNPDDALTLRAGITQRSTILQIRLSAQNRISHTFENINNQRLRYQSENMNYSIELRTLAKQYPNLTIGITQSFSNLSSPTTQNGFSQTQPFVSCEYYFKKQFSFKCDYNYTLYNNKASGTSNTYELANATITYSPKKSPWSFILTSSNVFNATIKNSNSFSQYIISDTRVFLQPRIVLFKVVYKL